MSDSDSEDITPSQPADDNADLPALFWDSMPDNPEEHPDYIALKALEEESTPEERAENFKVSLEHACVLPSGAGSSSSSSSSSSISVRVQHAVIRKLAYDTFVRYIAYQRVP
jgi:hypothetical protein